MLTSECKARNLAAMERDPNDRRHGTCTGWRYGCRCDECREAHRVEISRYRHNRKGGAKVTESERITSDADEQEEAPYLAIDPGKEEETTLNTECLDCGAKVKFTFAEMMRCAYDRERQRPACPKCGRRLEIGTVKTYDWDTGEWKEVD